MPPKWSGTGRSGLFGVFTFRECRIVRCRNYGKIVLLSAAAALAGGILLSSFVGGTAAPGPRTDRKVVYLVPDLPTFLYYLSAWNGDRRFPIFMARNKYFEKFVQVYKPETILKAKARKLGRIDPDLLRGAVYAAWGKETLTDLRRGVSRNRFKERLGRPGKGPQGIVLTDPAAKQLPAGLALAAAHRQALDFLRVSSPEGRTKPPVAVSFDEKEAIRKSVINLIEEWGFRYKGLGDEIDYITLALELPIGYMGLRSKSSGPQRLCLDDGINRLTPDGSVPAPKKEKAENPRGDCYAYVGRLLEADEGMALYQAMCSIFLGTSKALYFDRWPERWGLRAQEGWWVMQTKLHSTLVKTNASSLARWKKLVGELNPYGFLHVCSSGTARTWGDGKTSDIPESVPAIVYFAHSFSASNPYDETTVAGRWLRCGAYIYYGAISEPYAQSFNMPKTVAVGAVAGQPLGEAFQAKGALPTRFTFPWKQVYIGDPLHRIVFLDDETETEASRKFREAVSLLRERDLGPAIEILEDLLESAKDDAERKRIWEVLNKTFRLRFFGMRTGRTPLRQHVDSFFVDSWYNDTHYPNGEPTPAVVVNNRLNLFENELVALYEGLYRTREDRRRLKEVLGKTIPEMKEGAAHVKIWICAGPFQAEEDASEENPFRPDKILRLGASWQASGGKVGWQPAMVNPEDNVLSLASYPGNESVVYVACFPFLRSEKAATVRLGISATDPVEVWLNNDSVGPVPAAVGKNDREETIAVKLQPGENLLFFKIFRKGSRCELSARMTDPTGGYLEDVLYADPMAKLSAAGVKIDPEKWRPGN